MSILGKIKHAYPGGNTCKGFFSFYDYILPQEEAKRIIIMKGGPGVGKSTFMRKIGMEMTDEGYDVEFLHCSSDNTSLDGLVIPELKVALIDGTAPHIVDPKNPGCIDEIIHLGDFWDEKGLINNRNKITQISKEISSNFSRAYRYLSSAKSLYDDIEKINDEAIDFKEITKIRDRIKRDISVGNSSNDKLGKTRHIFLSAITPDGLRNFISASAGNADNIYVLNGYNSKYTAKMFSDLFDYFIERGYFVECCHCAFNPDVIEHLIIPELKTAIFSSKKHHLIPESTRFRIIEMDECMNKKIFEKFKEELEYNQTQLESLINQAVTTISKAKKLHDELETFYIPNMNFKDIEVLRKNTFKRILAY